LHQLRGRVGRSHHQAYAFLLTPEERAMTADALKRLDAIAATDSLGAGFQLATHDLEIRGAGELLGEEQSGQIQAIGYSLYMDLLERAVEAMRAGRDVEPELAAAPCARDQPARACIDSRRLPARRAQSPDHVQAHRIGAPPRKSCTASKSR
jgi:transcription-repair coupling factor (superfamily II helicase)